LNVNIHVGVPEDQTVAHSPERKPEEERCSLCLSPLRGRSDGRLVVETQCQHAFHLDCLRSCKEHGNEDCPLCRSCLPSGQGLTPMKCRSLKDEEDSPTHQASHLRPSEPLRTRGQRDLARHFSEDGYSDRHAHYRQSRRRHRQRLRQERRELGEGSEVCTVS
jgi:hypothetical protein